jgi:hypothetical protein
MDDLNIKNGSLEKVRYVFHIVLLVFFHWHALHIRITALEQLTSAPSVCTTFREKVSVNISDFGKDEEEGRDELDDRVARMLSFSLFVVSQLYLRASTISL